MNKSPVKTGYLCFRLATVISLILTIVLFFLRPERGNIFMVLSLAWMGLSAYSCVHIVSDMVAGQHTREHRFDASLVRWEDALGTRGKAVALYVGLTTASVVAKLAIPLLIQLS